MIFVVVIPKEEFAGGAPIHPGGQLKKKIKRVIKTHFEPPNTQRRIGGAAILFGYDTATKIFGHDIP